MEEAEGSSSRKPQEAASSAGEAAVASGHLSRGAPSPAMASHKRQKTPKAPSTSGRLCWRKRSGAGGLLGTGRDPEASPSPRAGAGGGCALCRLNGLGSVSQKRRGEGAVRPRRSSSEHVQNLSLSLLATLFPEARRQAVEGAGLLPGSRRTFNCGRSNFAVLLRNKSRGPKAAHSVRLQSSGRLPRRVTGVRTLCARSSRQTGPLAKLRRAPAFCSAPCSLPFRLAARGSRSFFVAPPLSRPPVRRRNVAVLLVWRAM